MVMPADVLYGRSGSYLGGGIQYSAGRALQGGVPSTPQQYTRDPASVAALRDYAGTLNAVGGRGILGAQNLSKATAWNQAPQIQQQQVNPTPLVGTTPWDATGGSWQKFLNPQNTPQVGPSSYSAPTGGPMLLDAQDTGMTLGGDYGLNQWVDAISQQLRYGQGARIDAAREQQVARGMGRSGPAILSEDAVRRETELEIATQAASAAVQQATLEQDSMKAYAQLKTSRDLANQTTTSAWAEFIDKGQQFKATLEHERHLANQQAQIQQSGNALQYAGILSSLETERVLANQETTRLFEEMRMTESQFTRSQNLQAWIETQAQNLGFAQLAETSRANDLQYGKGAAGTPGGTSWEDVVASFTGLMGAESGGLPLYDNSQAYNILQQMYPGMDWGSGANQFRIGAGLATPRTSAAVSPYVNPRG